MTTTWHMVSFQLPRRTIGTVCIQMPQSVMSCSNVECDGRGFVQFCASPAWFNAGYATVNVHIYGRRRRPPVGSKKIGDFMIYGTRGPQYNVAVEFPSQSR